MAQRFADRPGPSMGSPDRRTGPVCLDEGERLGVDFASPVKHR